MKPLASSPRSDGTLARAKRPRCRVEPEQVGEGAADVDADDGGCAAGTRLVAHRIEGGARNVTHHRSTNPS